MSIITSIETFVSTEIKKITGAAPKIEADLEAAATFGVNAVNSLKAYIATPQGTGLEAVIEAIPGIGTYAADVINFLPQLVVDLGWAKNEFTKSPADVLTDGLTVAINAATPNVKATNLATLAAHIGTVINPSATVQTLLSVIPAAYVAPATVTAN